MWNPAVEDEATDRAHRIGRDMPLFFDTLIAQRTLEEKIQSLKTLKAELAEALLSRGVSGRPELTVDDVRELLSANALGTRCASSNVSGVPNRKRPSARGGFTRRAPCCRWSSTRYGWPKTDAAL